MDVVRAKPMLDSILAPDEKQNITRGMLIQSAQTGEHHQSELQALGFIPLGKNPGMTASMDPTHRDSVGTNLLNDVANTVVGMPAGMYATGRAIGEDVKDIPGNLIHGRGNQDFRHTKSEVIDPIAQSYAHTYGPLFHGDTGEFAHRVGQHPLGPIMDVAALASGGLGAGARIGDAAAAVRAGGIADITEGAAAGGVKVGNKLTVQEMKNGNWLIHDGKNWLAQAPDKASAIKQAQALSTGVAMGKPFGVEGSTVSRAAQGFLKGGNTKGRGRFIDRYENKFGVDHEKELSTMVKELQSVAEDPNLRLGKRNPSDYTKQTFNQVLADLKQTRAYGKGKATRMLSEEPGEYSKLAARGIQTGATVLREASDLVRAGAIYLRPAYLPNNWAGNAFMNLTHQGFLAPINLGKSFVMDSNLGPRNRAMIDKSLGSNPAQIVGGGHGRGYISSVTHPLVEAMGAAADQPFRRAAWLHEARRDGFNNFGKVKDLMDKAQGGDQAALRQVADIGRRAQEEVVRFGKLNDAEKSVVQRLVFVYSWMKGAARYGVRYPLQHPIQSAAQTHMSQDIGQPFIKNELGGGLPHFLAGSIPVGKDKDGNPILINPFSLNPLGSAVQAGQAVAGSIKAAKGGGNFNQFVDTDAVSLTHPLIQSFITARGGGKSMVRNAEQSFAPYRFAHDLMHPGTGSTFPTSRKEAIGHWTLGSLFPRKADQQALTRSIEREKQGDPISRLPLDVQTISKAFGQGVIDPHLVQAYVHDLHEVERQKNFQKAYAMDHGSSGFRNMPPRNRAEAAIEFLGKGHITPAEARQLRSQLDGMKTDAEVASFASSLWNGSGIGSVKSQWDQMLHDARAQRLSRARK